MTRSAERDILNVKSPCYGGDYDFLFLSFSLFLVLGAPLPVRAFHFGVNSRFCLVIFSLRVDVILVGCFLFFILRVASFCLFFFPGFWMNRFSFTIVPVCFNGNLTVRYSLCKHCHEKMATPVAPWGCAIFQFLLSWTRDLIFCYFLDDNVRTEEMNYGHDEMARSSQKNPNQLMTLIRFFLFHSSARPENQRKMRSRRKFTMRTPPSSTMRHHLTATAAPPPAAAVTRKKRVGNEK